MKGQVTFGKKKLDKAFVSIYADTATSLVQKMESDNEGWVAFQLPIQKTYTIKISKAGHITKIISVDAVIPKSKEGNYYFEFSVDLFEEVEGLDVSVLKNPVAKIFFNTFAKKFDYDYNYTAKINNDVKKLYLDYESYKKTGILPAGEASSQFTAKTENKNPDSLNTIPVVKAPVSVVPKQKVIFSVQVLASSEQQQRNSVKFRGMVNVKELQEDGLYKYYTGEYSELSQAKKMLENMRGYFPSAFIIAFVEGIKISEKDAFDLIGE